MSSFRSYDSCWYRMRERSQGAEWVQSERSLTRVVKYIHRDWGTKICWGMGNILGSTLRRIYIFYSHPNREQNKEFLASPRNLLVKQQPPSILEEVKLSKQTCSNSKYNWASLANENCSFNIWLTKNCSDIFKSFEISL